MAGEKNGTDIGIYIGSDLVMAGQSLSWSNSRNAIETSNKDEGTNSTFIKGRKSGTLSASGLYIDATVTGYSYDDIYDEYASDSSTLPTFKWQETTPTTGHKYYSASGIITSLEADYPDDDATTYSMEVQLSGAITQTANA
jgi:hypothetical protein